MNTLKTLSIVAIMVLAFTACKNETQPEVKTVGMEVAESTDVSKTLDPNATYAKVEFGIDGMTCAMGCAKTIEKKMAKMEGVKSAKVDFDSRMAMVEYDEAKVTPESLEATVTKVAEIYKVKDMHQVDDFSKAEKKAE
ncbi:cation transporter [Winogradskyella vidalii]|uniref:cation transporter n=1 Tax=Winogradskyella vidalii TaxID=2615024 RepID=UPI0015C7BD11|nr:heavy metal-associated domain-containing protein [Winogradskyella vidalii]